MAKQMLNMPSFSGGLNSYLDPRDLKITQLSKAKNVMFDRNGMIKSIGQGEDIGPTLTQGMHTQSHGYGLLTFESSFNEGGALPATTFNVASLYADSEVFSLVPVAGDEPYESGSYWYTYSDGNGNIFQKTIDTDAWGEGFSLVHDDTEELSKCIFHLADEGIRISNADLKLNYRTKNKWFGVIRRENFFVGSDPETDYYFNGWYQLDNDIKKPTELDL